MIRPLTRLLVVLGFAVVASQAGHMLVYQLEYGSAAWRVQSQGAHAYFPLLVKTGFGLAAAVLLVGLLLVGAARVLAGSPVRRVVASPSFFQLFSLLFAIQLSCFVLQETAESLAAGAPQAPVINLILLGCLGQLPVAALTALVLKWLATRFQTALLVLRQPIAAITAPVLTFEIHQPRPAPALEPAFAQACPTVYTKRGPPNNLRG